jgi:hypothetical protein
MIKHMGLTTWIAHVRTATDTAPRATQLRGYSPNGDTPRDHYEYWAIDELLDELYRANRDVVPVIRYGIHQARKDKQPLFDELRRRGFPLDEYW